MREWIFKPLGDCVTQLKTGSTPPTSRPEYFNGSIPWYTPGDIGKDVDLSMSSRCLSEKAIVTGNAKLLDKGMLLVTCIGNIGRAGVLKRTSSANQQITALKFHEDIDVYYAYYWFVANRNKLEIIANQAIVPILNNERLEGVEFSYPTLPEQRRIAALLAKADRLRRLRRYALELGEGYLQAVFVEMFFTNPSPDWHYVEISSLAKKGSNTMRTGPFGSDLHHSEFVEKGIAVLGIDNAVQNRFTWGKFRFITKEKYEQLKRYTVFPGDVIITIMATTGRCAVIPNNIPLAINTKHLCCITLDQRKCLPVYLQSCFLNHPLVLKQLGVSERGAIMPGLNMQIIKELKIPLPDLELQEEFNRLHQKHERIISKQRESLRQAEHLFETLLHRAFRGEG